MTECSSHVTTRPVFLALSTIRSASIGLIVCMSMTSAEMPSVARRSAASRADWTISPQATIVTSVPSRMTMPLPISNSKFSTSLTTGTARRPKRM